MSVQTTFKNQSLHPKKSVYAGNHTTPIDGPVPGETTQSWSRISNRYDLECATLPNTAGINWVGGFRHTRRNHEYVEEVTVYHIHNLHNLHNSFIDDVSSRTSVWGVLWTDTETEMEPGFDRFYKTPSLRDARKLVVTLLANIPRADDAQLDWREAVHSVTDNIETLTVKEYDRAHEEALSQYKHWEDERASIHRNARYEWQSIKNQRKRLLWELEDEVEADENRGYSIRKTLPATTDEVESVKNEFCAGELTFAEFESALETAWENTRLVTHDQYLEQLISQDSSANT